MFNFCAKFYYVEDPEVKLVELDGDETTWGGSMLGYFKVFDGAFRSVKLDFPQRQLLERILPLWGSPHPEIFKAALRGFPDRVDDACAEYERLLLSTDVFLSELYVFEGSKTFLDQRRRVGNFALGLVTGMHPKLLKEKVLPKLNLEGEFDFIRSAYDVLPTQSKPNPFLALDIVGAAGVTVDQTVGVGDHKNDIHMFNNAGITSVATLTGVINTPELARRSDADYVISDLAHLKHVVNLARLSGSTVYIDRT